MFDRFGAGSSFHDDVPSHDERSSWDLCLAPKENSSTAGLGLGLFSRAQGHALRLVPRLNFNRRRPTSVRIQLAVTHSKVERVIYLCFVCAFPGEFVDEGSILAEWGMGFCLSRALLSLSPPPPSRGPSNRTLSLCSVLYYRTKSSRRRFVFPEFPFRIWKGPFASFCRHHVSPRVSWSDMDFLHAS